MVYSQEQQEEFGGKLEALKNVPGLAFKGLQKYGEGLDWTNDQVNIRNALRMNPVHQIGSRITGKDAFSEENTPDWLDNVLDYSYKDARDDISGGAGWAAEKLTGSKAVGQGAELLGQVLLPDAVDFATGGVGYLDNLGRLPGALKKISAKDGARIVEDVFNRSRFKAGEVYRGAQEGVQAVTDAVTSPIRTAKALIGGDSMVANFGTGLDKTIRELPNTLDPRGLRNWGSNKRKSGARFISGIDNEPAFIQAGWNVLEELNKGFGIDITRATAPFQIHHKGVIRQVAESANGLTDEAAKLAGDLISKKVGFKLGYDPSNAVPLPPQFHQRVHDIINDGISGRWGDNLEGLIDIRTGQALPRNWQTTMDLQARIDAGIYDQIADGINDHVEVINTFWDTVSTRTNLGKLTKKQYQEATMKALETDKKLKNLRRTRSQSPGEDYNLIDGVNELLQRAERVDLTSPIFTELAGDMTEEAYKFALQDNGQEALLEVLFSGQDSATVFKTYGIETKGFEPLLKQLGIPGISPGKTLRKRRGRPEGSPNKNPKGSLSTKRNQKKYFDDPDVTPPPQ